MLSNELRYFFAVATTGSLSTASEQLYVATNPQAGDPAGRHAL